MSAQQCERNQGPAERAGRMHSSELGLKQATGSLEDAKAQGGQGNVQGNVQCTPSRCNREGQCNERARKQKRGTSPVYLTPYPTRGRATWRETSKDGRGLVSQRATDNAPAMQEQAGH
ncbi:hypothetical protein V6N13_061517 [Hibiscus sabdariffa]